MEFQKAAPGDFLRVRQFYWDLIDAMADQNDTIGWKKGVYPADDFLRESLERGELYLLTEDGALAASVVLNSACNPGYDGAPWTVDCTPEEVLIPHALAVDPSLQGRGLGRRLVRELFALARSQGKKAVRLDILGTNAGAERLYTGMGFRFVQARTLFYEDTGWTEYRLFEYPL